MRRTLPVLTLFLSTLALPALAQTPPPLQPSAPTGPVTGQMTPAPASSSSAQLPQMPAPNDPMLAPVARPRVEIASWQEALTYVRRLSTDLRISLEQVERNEGQARVALAGALTTINGNVTYTHNLITKDLTQNIPGAGGTGTTVTSVPTKDALTGGVTLIQPVFAPRAWYAIGTADRNTDAARISVDDAKRKLALGIAKAIVDVVTAERAAEINRVGLANALTRLELTQRRTALGSGTGIDVVRAGQDVEAARATLVSGDELLRQARESLGLAVGVPEQVGVPTNVDLSTLDEQARGSCRQVNRIEDRPDVAALEKKAEVAHRLHNDVKYQFSPTVDFRSGLATTSYDPPGNQTPLTTWNIQAVLTVPIWDGGIKYGNLRTTAADEDIAMQNVEAQRRTANVEVTRARRNVKVAEDRRDVSLKARDLAAENDRLTRTSYLEGRGTSLELVDAARLLRLAELDLAQRDFDLVNAKVVAVLALATCPW